VKPLNRKLSFSNDGFSSYETIFFANLLNYGVEFLNLQKKTIFFLT